VGASEAGLGEASAGGRVRYNNAIVEKVSSDRLRLTRLAIEADPATPLDSGDHEVRAVSLIDISRASDNDTIAALTDDCTLWLKKPRKRTNLLTGISTITLSGGSVHLRVCEDRGSLPAHLFLSSNADAVYLVWRDGIAVRVDAREPDAMLPVETRRLVSDGAARLTAMAFLAGKTTLVVGDSIGTVSAWFPAKPLDAEASDGVRLERGHFFEGTGSAVAAIAPSVRTRMVAIAHADGLIRLLHVTSGQELAAVQLPPRAWLHGAAIGPRDDSLYALAGTKLISWAVRAQYPEVSLKALFAPVWYEGASAPAHVWQSSSGSDDFEPKLSLMPLIFGTLKATLYSIMFGAPLAMLAAIYSSEMLHQRARAIVKPTIEFMASLPSVVLGFFAALVIGPWVDAALPAILLSFYTIPALLFSAARLSSALPTASRARLERMRVAVSVPVIGLGILAASSGAPVLERALFAGDLKAWLDGGAGNVSAAWTFIVMPPVALATMFIAARLQKVQSTHSGGTSAHRGRWPVLGSMLLWLSPWLFAVLIGVGLEALSLDPRGALLGTYVQRNALVVGFVMGFAIIPLIYTLADDALSSVPSHLRAASLALGATRWQTTARIVIPTAMSGLFAALMIGLGRAIGETMIVLMAAGNTPVMDWNVFNGFRTLSANIAVELPEAVQNSSHYRVLFFAALVLFLMTFVLNTVAELVRLRFRRRAQSL